MLKKVVPVACLAFACHSVSATDSLSRSIKQSSTEYLVVFDTEMSSEKVTHIVNAINAQLDHNQKPVKAMTLLNGFSGTVPANWLNKLRKLDHVAAIEANRAMDLPVQPKASQMQTMWRVATDSWGVDRLDQANLPLDMSYSPAYDGAGAHVYVLDTGIHTSHVQFDGRASWAFTAPGISEGNGDLNGHGTHMSAIVAGSSYGVAPQANVYGVKVLDGNGQGTLADLIAGIEYVTANHQDPAVAVIGSSMGYSQILNDTIAASINAGVTYALPSGDDNRDACSYSPASLTAGITVAASDINDNVSLSSNKGECVDVYAPGLYVKSAWPITDFANNTISHSPLAAAYVAGAAALVRGNDPSCDVAQVKEKVLGFSRANQLALVPANTPNLLLGVPSTIDAGFACAPQQGEQITVRRVYPDLNTDYVVGPQVVNVVDGDSDIIGVQSHVYVNIDSDKIVMDYQNSSRFVSGSGVFDGYTFTGFSQPLQNVTINAVGVTVYSLDFGDDYIHLALTGGFSSGTHIEMTLSF